MHTQGADGRPQGLGNAAKQVAEHASSLARLEVELVLVELKAKVASLGKGIALGLGAVLFVLYALGFGLAALAAGLATAMSAWLALLIVTGGLVVVAVLLGLLAMSAVKRGTPPMPEQAIREAKVTAEVLKSDGR
jgi:uncharacterized membrane protein YqjE